MQANQTPAWLEYAKLAASIATPLVVATLGVLLLRRVESVKAAVAKHSDFQRKWADGFFSCCQEFLVTVEQELALLTTVSCGRGGKPLSPDVIDTLNGFHVRLSELELRIRRSMVFAPKSGMAVTASATECIHDLHALLANGGGSVDALLESMNGFNRATRSAHAEMLGLAREPTISRPSQQ